MGVDSGLPDFRGNEGFWKEYPAIAKLKLDFSEMANPQWFVKDPKFAWGFYAHRYNLYNNTIPHSGFDILEAFILKNNLDHFIVTSNVDNQFQEAGFESDHIYEIHGRINFNQCTSCSSVWENQSSYTIDQEKLLLTSEVPCCPECGSLARPNILMFEDFQYNDNISSLQEKKFIEFCEKYENNDLLVIEIGAGIAIPSIRHITESFMNKGYDCVRINPVKSDNLPRMHYIELGGSDGIDLLFGRGNKCSCCDKIATWSYMPGISNYCDDCLPRGCSCNNESFSEAKDAYSKEEQIKNLLYAGHNVKLVNYGSSIHVSGSELEVFTDMKFIRALCNNLTLSQLTHYSVIPLDKNNLELPCCEYWEI